MIFYLLTLTNVFGTNFRTTLGAMKHAKLPTSLLDNRAAAFAGVKSEEGTYHIQTSSNWYSIHKVAKQQNEARADCQSRGGDLASILSEKENALLDGQFDDSIHEHFWIGLTTSKTGVASTWLDGQKVDYSQYSAIDPDGCVISKSTVTWTDHGCD